MRVLVTGGSGFVGCHLVRRLLSEAHEVTLLVSPYYRGERLADVEGRFTAVTGAAAAAALRPEVIYHLASTPFNPPGTPWATHFRVIVQQTAELLDVFSGTGVRFLYTGSGAEYGQATGAEGAPALEPATLLGGCKAAASVLVQTLGRLGQIHTTVLRLFTPFGPWEPPHRLLPSILRSAQRGEDVRLSSGDSQRDFCYVSDVVEAMVRAASAPLAAGAAVDLCSGTPLRVREMARLALGVLGHPVQIREDGERRPDEITAMRGSTLAARQLLGWTPATPLVEGIERTVSWFQQNPQWLRMPA